MKNEIVKCQIEKEEMWPIYIPRMWGFPNDLKDEVPEELYARWEKNQGEFAEIQKELREIYIARKEREEEK
jgi:hypothetical protein